jgi:superoxide dismutase, Cu-Zn family
MQTFRLSPVLIFLLLVVGLISLYLGSRFYYFSPFYKSITRAVAVMHPTKGNSASGVVTFEQKSDGLHIRAEMEGLAEGKHGFHVHELGDCSCDDGMCTAGHYDPTRQPHGGPNSKRKHVGDFGNIVADADGKAVYELVSDYTTLNGPNSIIGRGLIVHADPDDLVSQPTGDAGARIGCGVIGIAK